MSIDIFVIYVDMYRQITSLTKPIIVVVRSETTCLRVMHRQAKQSKLKFCVETQDIASLRSINKYWNGACIYTL
jgi:hypothetical protein